MGYKLMLKSIRQSRGINQQEMAEKLGMRLSTYRTWEQGVSRINLEDACKISEILGCTPNDLCGWYEDHPRESRTESTDPYARELMDCFDGSSQEGRRTIINVARSMLETTGGAAQRGAVQSEEEIA